jgi:hypothetical protein
MKIATMFLAGLLLSCGTPNAVLPTVRPETAPTVTIAADTVTPAVLATIPTDAPTAEVLAPTAVLHVPIVAVHAPAPTAVVHVPIAVAPAPLLGAAPNGSDCPADHPVKGNGDKIYHLPASASYKATKPERCFVDAHEAEAAGFRAVK